MGHNQVELLMRRAGLQGVTGRRKCTRIRGDASDLVERTFTRSGPDQLWVTDITEHPTREGKVYCCVVLDTYSRGAVGWSVQQTRLLTERRPGHERPREGHRQPAL